MDKTLDCFWHYSKLRLYLWYFAKLRIIYDNFPLNYNFVLNMVIFLTRVLITNHWNNKMGCTTFMIQIPTVKWDGQLSVRLSIHLTGGS